MKTHNNKSNHKRPANKGSESRHPQPRTKEFGGPKGPEPTRFGDWEHCGRCSDF